MKTRAGGAGEVLFSPLAGGEDAERIAVFGDGAAGNGDAFCGEQLFQPGIRERVARVFFFNQGAQARNVEVTLERQVEKKWRSS